MFICLAPDNLMIFLHIMCYAHIAAAVLGAFGSIKVKSYLKSNNFNLHNIVILTEYFVIFNIILLLILKHNVFLYSILFYLLQILINFLFFLGITILI